LVLADTKITADQLACISVVLTTTRKLVRKLNVEGKFLEESRDVEIKEKLHSKNELKLYSFTKSETWQEDCRKLFFLLVALEPIVD
jgi:hypothetical protein